MGRFESEKSNHLLAAAAAPNAHRAPALVHGSRMASYDQHDFSAAAACFSLPVASNPHW